MYLVQCVMHMYRTKPNWMLELRKVVLWVMTGLALHFLCTTHIKTPIKKIRCVKFTEGFDNIDESVELLPDSVKPGEPEMPKHENEDE